MEEVRALTVPQSVVAHPNPFTNSTTVRYSSRFSAQSSVRLYDAAGNVVRTQPAGSSCVISGAGLKPGVYVLRAGEQSTRLVKVTN